MAQNKGSNQLIQQLLKAEEEADLVIKKAKDVRAKMLKEAETTATEELKIFRAKEKERLNKGHKEVMCRQSITMWKYYCTDTACAYTSADITFPLFIICALYYVDGRTHVLVHPLITIPLPSLFSTPQKTTAEDEAVTLIEQNTKEEIKKYKELFKKNKEQVAQFVFDKVFNVDLTIPDCTQKSL
ncbi:vacuolar ATP synthase subunit g, putative [Plasmodium knowlesi strain H]|uniref:Vacuolar ATP synthase subunit g, putative n=1 Tax=Plasmodium knowlesi (strain H) TaxID=5851 RepID=A0A193RB31_PLAKH|nr:vacuolar ATP synthase subunit g, putative [Plasmodium knowlesi strain H]SBO27890.1 vacuolar ATP synthase subunit g, putative [Plasmodium knowlesi strain H]